MAIAEVTEYVCADCGGTSWVLKILHEDNKTILLVICSNQECVERKAYELGIEDSQSTFPVWDEFNITGQGKDKKDLSFYDQSIPLDKNQIN